MHPSQLGELKFQQCMEGQWHLKVSRYIYTEIKTYVCSSDL